MYAVPALDTDRASLGRRFGDGSPWRLIVFGFIYWVAIVTALEPGNIVNMLAAGASPRWGQEMLRIVGAGLLGSSTVPAFVSLSRRFPVADPHLWRNALIHLTCAIVVAAALIIVAHVLAIWLFGSAHRMTMAGLRDDLAANELLLVVGLVALSGLAHLVSSRLSPAGPSSARSSAAPNPRVGHDAMAPKSPEPTIAALETVEIKVRGLTKRVPVGDIEWIEAQGNYLALHVGAAVFLRRETLASFEARLDPAHFIRIHRRTIVAVDRITRTERTANGDGIVWLKDSQALRVSRLYRKALSRRISL